MTARQNPDPDNAPAFTTLELLTTVVVVGVLALALGLVALVMPTQTTDKKSAAYTQSGRFGYAATAPSSSVYGPKGLSPGEPILLDLVGPVTTNFAYRLTGQSVAGLHGTASMSAMVKLSQGLSRKFPVAMQKSFSGDRVTLSGTLPVEAIQNYVTKSQKSFGNDFSSTSGATISLQPTVKVRGALAGHALNTTYAPKLPFTLSGKTLTVGQVTDVSAAPEQSTSNPLKPSAQGKVAYRSITTNRVSLLIVHPSVTLARGLGLGIAFICLLLGLWLARPLLRAGSGSERARIQTLYGSRIVEVRELALPDGPVADLAGMDALADVAKRYESVIMHVNDAEGDAYLVWDGGLLYRYRPPAPVFSEYDAPQPAAGADAPETSTVTHPSGAASVNATSPTPNTEAKPEHGPLLTKQKPPRLNGKGPR